MLLFFNTPNNCSTFSDSSPPSAEHDRGLPVTVTSRGPLTKANKWVALLPVEMTRGVTTEQVHAASSGDSALITLRTLSESDGSFGSTRMWNIESSISEPLLPSGVHIQHITWNLFMTQICEISRNPFSAGPEKQVNILLLITAVVYVWFYDI